MKKYTIEDVGLFKYAKVKTTRVVYADNFEDAISLIDCGKGNDISTEVLDLEKELEYEYKILEEVEV